jgi:hypothetical protein
MHTFVSNVTNSTALSGGGVQRVLRTVESAAVKELDCHQAQRAAYHNAFHHLSL